MRTGLLIGILPFQSGKPARSLKEKTSSLKISVL